MRLLTTLLLLLPLSAFATVSLESQPYKVVMATQDDGSVAEEWVKADKIAPGDKVGYRITYVNTGSEPVSGVTIKNPVPENTVYIMNSANGAGTSITLSVDGSQFAPGERTERTGKRRSPSCRCERHTKYSLDC